MLPSYQLIVLALVQGITEFLPISSSGHLALVPVVTGWQDQGLLIDVALHVGTLFAVLVYFWRDLWMMLVGLGQLIKGRRKPGARLVGLLILASIPLVIAGFFMNEYAGDMFRNVEIIGWATIGFGILLYGADRIGMTVKQVEHLGPWSALFLGLSQILALVPGTSRSGITMTAGRFLGMERKEAARFSMLMGIPALAGAGVLKGIELYELGNVQLTSDAVTAAILAFISALIAIAVMMSWLKRATFTPFVFYRLVLGGVLLYLFYSGMLSGEGIAAG